ncbi:hypothetical protein J4410_07250 [Candidatus Woesearchaeota archaeon]|nr:hypothetical protein [Candidatus Woesearchaeota archaeon]
MIENFIRQFTKKKIVDQKDLLVLHEKCFFVNERLKKTMEIIAKKTSQEPIYAGLYLGKQKGYTFFPSVSLLEIIKPFVHDVIVVNDEVAFLFICGRDIFSQGILKKRGTCAENTLVFVEDKENNLLGFGKRVHPITSKKEVVTNIFDVGDFLRREKD